MDVSKMTPGHSYKVGWTSRTGQKMEAVYTRPILVPHQRNERIAMMTALRAERDARKAEFKKAAEQMRKMMVDNPPPSRGRLAKLRRVERQHERMALIAARKKGQQR